MNRIKLFVKSFFIITLLINLTGALPQKAQAKSDSLIAPESLLRPDGTLQLDGSFSGALDLEGWDVQMNPQAGPVFKPIANDNEWNSLGSGSGAINGTVHAIAVDGSDVYVGGDFQDVNGIPEADFIARWDGTIWHALGGLGANGALNSSVYAIQVYSSGVIYVGGQFTNVRANNGATTLLAADYIARWDGDWSALGYGVGGNGALNNGVYSLAIDGDDIYAGGFFTDVNNMGSTLTAADYVARFNSGSDDWYALGGWDCGGVMCGALNNTVMAIDINDTGIYLGGYFNNVVNVDGSTLTAADYIVHWDWTNSEWVSLGADNLGNGSLNSAVLALVVRGSGASTQVVAGGYFNAVWNGGQVLPGFLSYYDGADWGQMTADPSPINASVYSIYNTGNTFYIGGSFEDANGIPEADYVVKLEGTTWSALGSNGAGNGSIPQTLDASAHVRAIAVSGSALYLGGIIENVSNNGSPLPAASGVAMYNSGTWSALGPQNGALEIQYGNIAALETQGNDLYIGGVFNTTNNGVKIPEAYNLVKWDGTNFSALGNSGPGIPAVNSYVYSIASDRDNVYVGGSFTNVGGDAEADYLAHWDGATWSDIGGGLNDTVYAVEIAPNGDLYVGGGFTNAGGNPAADYLARWDGAAWQAVGAGDCAGVVCGSLDSIVFAIAFSGNDVYAGGGFTNVRNGATEIPEADYIAKWNGSAWSALGSNGFGNGAVGDTVLAIAIQENNVYAGGHFMNVAGNNDMDFIARWDGAAWNAMGVQGDITTYVHSILPYQSSPGIYEIYVGGQFINAGGVPEADYVAEFHHSGVWQAVSSNGAGNGSLSSSASNWVTALALQNSDLLVGGYFNNVNDNGTVLHKADGVAAYGLPDLTPPQVVSIARSSASPTSAASVNFEVTFSESVTGVGNADFSLTKTGGVSGESVTSVSGSGALYTVTVNTGSGDGTIRLDVPASAAIQDLNGLDISGLPFTGGESYTIEKNSAPTNITLTNENVAENLSAGASVGNLSTTDPDAGDTFTYTLVSGTGSVDNAAFSISGNTLKTAQPFNFLNKSSYSIRVRSTDNGGLFTEKAFTISITDTPPIFADVPDSYWAVSFIERLYNNGITGGCTTSPLNYCPDNNVTRAQMAVFLEKALHHLPYTPPDVPATFNDTIGHWAEDWIEALKNDGITSGCAAGLYCPENSVTRAQMAVFLLKSTHGASYSPPLATGTFSDVATDHWAAAWIEQLAAEGITSGCGSGIYCPENAVTRAQMAVFLVKAFNLP